MDIEQQEVDLDQCGKCGSVQGFHCLNCHQQVADLKDKKAIKKHNEQCSSAVWLNPLVGEDIE